MTLDWQRVPIFSPIMQYLALVTPVLTCLKCKVFLSVSLHAEDTLKSIFLWGGGGTYSSSVEKGKVRSNWYVTLEVDSGCNIRLICDTSRSKVSQAWMAVWQLGLRRGRHRKTFDVIIITLVIVSIVIIISHRSSLVGLQPNLFGGVDFFWKDKMPHWQ